MADQSKQERIAPLSGAVITSVDALAARALSLVVSRSQKINKQVNTAIADKLREAAIEPMADGVPQWVGKMLASGIAAETIAVTYIPHVARQLGEDWCDDTLSFARVTIGTARLQAALRLLGSEWSFHGPDDDDPLSGGVVVVVPQGADHTLGALVLCGQLRRGGYPVRLSLGASVQDLESLLSTTQFDAVLLSSSGTESRPVLRGWVDVIRASAKNGPPIIIGGNVLDQDADICGATGADYASNDPFAALAHCGLKKSHPGDAPAADRHP